MSVAGNENTNAIEQFDGELAEASMVGQWKFDHLLEQVIGGPIPAGEPFLWSWEKTVKTMFDKALIALPDSTTVRRNLAFSNPGLPTGTTHTILGSMQMVKPGELAWAHSHSPSALRFAIEGDERLYTVVNGEALMMKKHDLVLTPAWTWHDHHNESDKMGLWLDVLDLPMVGALKQMSYRIFGDTAQNIEKPLQPNSDYNKALRFPWSEVEEKLAAAGNDVGDPYDAIMLEYKNPETGGSAMATLSCNVQMFQPGIVTQEKRTTSSVFCYVVEGRGKTIIGGKEISWKERDVFVIPNWVWHSHINQSDSQRAILFVVNDSPVLKAMGIARQEKR
jgi:gentisate 1,2-dioxygenase/1-hydroxy-2-naphthoate dioxygenase